MSERIKNLIPKVAKKLAKQKEKSTSGSDCLYTTCNVKGDTIHCLVGHLMNKRAQQKVGRFIGDVGDLVSEFPKALAANLPDITREEVRILNRMQTYHDESGYTLAIENSKTTAELTRRIEADLHHIVDTFE